MMITYTSIRVEWGCRIILEAPIWVEGRVTMRLHASIRVDGDVGYFYRLPIRLNEHK